MVRRGVYGVMNERDNEQYHQVICTIYQRERHKFPAYPPRGVSSVAYIATFSSRVQAPTTVGITKIKRYTCSLGRKESIPKKPNHLGLYVPAAINAVCSATFETRSAHPPFLVWEMLYLRILVETQGNNVAGAAYVHTRNKLSIYWQGKGARALFPPFTDLWELHLATSHHHVLHLFQLVDSVENAIPWSRRHTRKNAKQRMEKKNQLLVDTEPKGLMTGD